MSQNIISHDQHAKMMNKQKRTQLTLKTEIERLDTKKANINAYEQNAKRSILLNQSYKEKQKMYLILLVTFVIMFGLCLILFYVQERLGYSSVFFDLLILLILVSGFISAYFQYESIQVRDKIDFSKLNDTMLLHPSKFKENDYNEAKQGGKISEMSASICKGAECCGPGFIYDTDLNKCK